MNEIDRVIITVQPVFKNGLRYEPSQWEAKPPAHDNKDGGQWAQDIWFAVKEVAQEHSAEEIPS